MGDLFPVSLDDEIACVERELQMRHHVYPRWVDSGRMKADKAAREIETMNAILHRLQEIKLGEG